ncbi:transcription termination factor 4, mitochondrial isoform X2 [Mustela lutreola]|uniref:transcription termination factor 4, mitochondrial isoform X2 n=1 Tax=Mustela lutreola TaxID=9666 RepID=UPI0027972424|nr:transcription termination factor 4, mitochondrial isoform X2 [Mustela lutreola]
MAALGRQVFDWHRLVPLTWAHVARQTHRGEQKRTCPCLLYKLTTASNGGGLEKLSHVESRTYVQEPACRMRFTQYSLEKRRTPVAPGFVEREKVISSLLDMGFSDVHINGLLHLWPSTHTQQLLDIISELILLGLNPEPVYMALKQSPQLLKLPILHMKKRSGYLRKLGLGEGKLKTVLLCCPEIFTMHQRDIDSIVGVLKEKCLFTVQQVTKILHRCPYVLREDPGELEYKFQGKDQDGSHLPRMAVVQRPVFRQERPEKGTWRSLCRRGSRSRPHCPPAGPLAGVPSRVPSTLVHERTSLPPQLCAVWFMLSTHFLLGTLN